MTNTQAIAKGIKRKDEKERRNERKGEGRKAKRKKRRKKGGKGAMSQEKGKLSFDSSVFFVEILVQFHKS